MPIQAVVTPEAGLRTVENLIFADVAGKTISGAVFYHPPKAWRQERFTKEQRENPDIVGDFKDPDGDEFTNIMEFLIATNPLTSSTRRRPWKVLE